jgi:putative toxin-antitoxin system antitoxin component (TIGR02293 family)
MTISRHLSTAAPGTQPSPALVAQEQAAVWRTADAANAAVSSGAMALLGGARALPHWPQSRAEIHGTLVQGLPAAVLLNLLDRLDLLALDDVAAALGLSSRTLRRLRDQPERALPPDLASKAWQLAELLAQAGVVFGDAAAAQRWLAAPVMGLDGARPIDLLRTLQGSELVAEFLGRLEHGVYN